MNTTARPISPDLNQIAKLMDRSHPQVVLVVGTGVAINATGQPNASWLGLLKHGIRDLVSRERFTSKYGEELETSLNAAFSPFQLQVALNHAETVEQVLNTPDEKAFAQWLTSAFANFKTRNDEKAKAPLEALRDLHEAGALLLTTNYDSLLSDVTGVAPVTWEEHADFHRVITRQKAGILHVHGHWQRPSSIVLGRSSYDRVVSDNDLQQLFRTLWLDWSWIYVGCGDGLDDPNLGRLLEWSKGWGVSALPDFFLAREDKAKEIAARPGKPMNLRPIGYPSHEGLPDVLRSITPAARCWPFLRVDDDFPLFHVPGANDPFPTRQEYLDGDVPSFAADAELLNRLQTHGWACCIDVASVGKTTFALRAATTQEQRAHPVFYLDLKKEIADNPDASPVAVVHRLARPGTLLILDNIHYQSELAHQLWQQWNATPSNSRGRLLLVATRIHQPIVVTPEQDLMFFERHPANPSVLLQPTPADLGRLAKHLYDRVGGSKCPPMPDPPVAVLAEWHSVYRAALNAFTFAVLDSLADFQKGKWPLPPSRASAWVRKHWLVRLDATELENTICLAAFGAQELEMLVQNEALPHPGKTEKLFELGLVAQTQCGQLKQYRQLGLREPGWGLLILAALTPPVDVEQTLFAAASRHLLTAIVLSARLRRGHSYARLKRLFAYIADSADQLVNQTGDLPLQNFMNLVQLAEAGGRLELADRFWEALEHNLDNLTAISWETPLEHLAVFLENAKEHPVITKAIWKALESEPQKLIFRTFESQLNLVSIFLDRAQGHPLVTKAIWDAFENEPQKLAALAWNTPLNWVVAFIEKAQAHPAVTKIIWEALESEPQKLAALTWDTPLISVIHFLDKAQTHPAVTKAIWNAFECEPQKLADLTWDTPLSAVIHFLNKAQAHPAVTKTIWDALEKSPQKLIAAMWETPLAEVAILLGRAHQHPVVTKTVWQELENKPQKLTARALKTQLHLLAVFLDKAREYPAVQRTIWEAFKKEPQQLSALVWDTPLSDVATFLEKAREQPDVTQTVWQALEDHSDNLAFLAWKTPLGQLGKFLRYAEEHPVVTNLISEAFKNEPDRFARKGFEATLNDLIGFAHYASKEMLEIVLCGIDPGKWNGISPDEGMAGATWLVWNFGRLNRDDLAADLATLLLRRANWRDFPPQSGGFAQACWLLANAPSSAVGLVEPFCAAVCTEKWLQVAYATTSCGQLASGLRQMALHQSVERCRQFHHKELGWRLNKELAGFETAAPLNQAQIIQLLGCTGLCGWAVSHRNVASIMIESVSQLPLSILPHRPEVAKVEDHQMQLWLGLRNFGSITRKRLSLPRETIEETLKLWHANLGETNSKPGATAHRVNRCMVTWLEACLREDPPALVPSKEPLWTLVGFPRRLVQPS